jgi:hypothetical protein
MGSPQSADFCSNCGSAVDPDDSFCSNCGSAVGGSATGGSTVGDTAAGSTAGRSGAGGSTAGQSGASGSTAGRSGLGRATASDRSLRRRVEDLTIEGWEVEHDYGDRVVLVDRGFGSWGIHAILAVFTGGLGNVAYAWYNYSPGADRIELRSDGTERYLSGSGSTVDSTDASNSRDVTAKNVAVSVFLALVGIAILDGVGSVAALFLGVTFVLAALFTFPPTRERFEDRKPVTTFGRAHSTDEEVVTAPDQPCTACSRPVGTGVKRTYRERTYVAGIPITTNEEGENVYCRSCANGDPFTTTTGDDGADREKEFEL